MPGKNPQDKTEKKALVQEAPVVKTAPKKDKARSQSKERSASPAPKTKSVKKVEEVKTAPPQKQADKSSVKKSAKEETKQMQVDKNAASKDKGPSPKKASSAYMFFNTEYAGKVRKENPGLSMGDAFKQAGAKWGTMSEKEKAPFEKMASEDKIRHEKQLAEREKKGYFTLADKTKSTDPENAKLFKKKKSKGGESEDEDECLKPKRAMSAYIFFSNGYIEQLRKSHPDKKQGEFMQMAGQKWSEMTDAQKQPYNDMNVADKARQQKQEAELEKKGYFILENGTKSTDPENVPKKRKTQKASKSMIEVPEVQPKKAQKKAQN